MKQLAKFLRIKSKKQKDVPRGNTEISYVRPHVYIKPAYPIYKNGFLRAISFDQVDLNKSFDKKFPNHLSPSHFAFLHSIIIENLDRHDNLDFFIVVDEINIGIEHAYYISFQRLSHDSVMVEVHTDTHEVLMTIAINNDKFVVDDQIFFYEGEILNCIINNTKIYLKNNSILIDDNGRISV